MKRTTILLLACLCVTLTQAQAQKSQPSNPSDAGTHYINPIVRADFPDPDVIRVGSTYYMVSTTMQLFPGATIIKSEDLVNWEYCAQPLKSLLQPPQRQERLRQGHVGFVDEVPQRTVLAPRQR